MLITSGSKFPLPALPRSFLLLFPAVASRVFHPGCFDFKCFL